MTGRQITIWDFGVETAEPPHAPAMAEAFEDLADWAPVSWPEEARAAGDQFPEAPRFRFRLDDGAIAQAFPQALHRELIASPGFQRLRDIATSPFWGSSTGCFIRTASPLSSDTTATIIRWGWLCWRSAIAGWPGFNPGTATF